MAGALENTTYARTGEPAYDAFRKTLLLGLLREGEQWKSLLERFEKADRFSRIFRSLYRWRLGFAIWLVLPLLIPLSILLRDPSDNIRVRTAVVGGRKFFKSEDGLIGLATWGAQPGDVVVVVKGARVPLVMRSVGAAWCLVGDAYVHGIMNGEAFEEKRCTEMKLV